jgi:hypothetical protein
MANFVHVQTNKNRITTPNIIFAKTNKSMRLIIIDPAASTTNNLERGRIVKGNYILQATKGKFDSSTPVHTSLVNSHPPRTGP